MPVPFLRLPQPGLWMLRLMVVRQGNTICGVPMKLLVTLFQDEDGVVIAGCPAIPGCVSQGTTEEEALRNIGEAIQECLEVRSERGMPLARETREIEVPA